MLETDSEMKRIFARSQLTISRKPSAAWQIHRHISQRWWQRHSRGGTWVPTLSRRCLRSSCGRMEGFKVVSEKALLVPAARDQNHFRLNKPDLSDVFKTQGALRGTSEGFQVLHGLPEHSEFVQLSGHGLAGRDHGRQLVNQIVHFIPPSLLNLAVRLPADTVSVIKSTLCVRRRIIHNAVWKSFTLTIRRRISP